MAKQKRIRKTDAELLAFFRSVAADILSHPNAEKMKGYVQHGTTSCYEHSVAVAYFALKLCNRWNWRCDERALVRGGLLHDFFLYDWHAKREESKRKGLHGYTHPRKALENAVREFELTKLERNIILRHMFPLTLVPPRYKESLLVCLADKYCSLKEVFQKKPYGEIAFFAK